MISVEARGRLGNHMFQFAFGLGASSLLRTDFVMAEDLLRERFALVPHAGPLGRARRAVVYRIRRQLAPYPVVKIEPEAEPDTVLTGLRDRTHYAGFFQSERFFLPMAAAVRRAFEPRPEHQRAFLSRYERLANGSYVCCHVRRTDYAAWRGGVVLPIAYYERCIREATHDHSMPIVFVGDDLSEVESAFGGRPGFRFERNSEIVDLQLLVHAAVAVCSNSSFGWWGAWLGSPDRRVFAPRHWLGFKSRDEWPRNVVPAAWKQIDVEAPAYRKDGSCCSIHAR